MRTDSHFNPTPLINPAPLVATSLKRAREQAEAADEVLLDAYEIVKCARRNVLKNTKVLQEAQTRAQKLRIQLGEIEEKAREAFEDLVDDKRLLRDAELRAKMAITRFKGAQREVLRLEEEKRVEERNTRKARAIRVLIDRDEYLNSRSDISSEAALHQLVRALSRADKPWSPFLQDEDLSRLYVRLRALDEVMSNPNGDQDNKMDEYAEKMPRIDRDLWRLVKHKYPRRVSIWHSSEEIQEIGNLYSDDSDGGDE